MSGVNPSLGAVFGRFSDFEREAGMFSREVCGVRFWHYVRFSIYSTLVLPRFVPMEAAHPDMHVKAGRGGGILRRIASKCLSPLQLLRMLVLQNPMFAVRRSDVLFSVAPRTTLLPDGRRVRISIDFFVDRLKSSWSVLELPVGSLGYQANDGCGRTFKWEAAKRAIARYRRSPVFRSAMAEIAAAAKSLSVEMSERLGIPVDEATVARRLEFAVVLERAAVPLLRRWLRRLRVKCVVEVVHYGSANMALTRAAHEEGLPVVELQHGTVYLAHAAYNLPVKGSPCTPDYMFGWGERWLEQMTNFPLRKSVAVGYPYIELFSASRPRFKAGDGAFRVLFISQGTVGGDLASVAVELARLLPSTRFSISFKLHPNEMRSWRKLYPCILGSAVNVVDDPSKSIYECFADSDATVGACSTALIEGFVWGLKSYIMRWLAGADTMAMFCNGKQARYIDTVAELASCILADAERQSACGALIDGEAYFKSGSPDAMAAWIDRIVEARDADDGN